MQIWLDCPLWTIITDSIDYPMWEAHGRFNVAMNDSNRLTPATSAGDSGLAAVIHSTRLDAEQDDRYRPNDGRATGGRDALLQEELLKLRKRCRANEVALASVVRALSTLRRANRALNDENMLLRQQVVELGERASRKPWPNVRGGGRPVASDG